MKNILTLKMWFNIHPGNLTNGATIVILFILLALFISSIIFWILKKKKNNIYFRIWKKLYFFGVSNFIIGMLLYFFAYELLPFLSMRFWFLLWWVGMLAWTVHIFRIFKEIPKIKALRAKEDEYKKYIPK